MTDLERMVYHYKFFMDGYHIPICTETKYIGTLVPLNYWRCNLYDIYSSMSNWRHKHMKWFLTRFDSTPERTNNWLNNSYLQDTKKLLFLAYSYPDNTFIGHYGINRITEKSSELDNGLRGVPGGAKGFMHYMEIALLSWMFGVLKMETANLWILSHNEQVKKWHLSTGYTYGRVKSLSKVVTKNETKLLVDSKEGEPVDFHYQEFVHSKEALIKAHPWVLNVYPWRD